MKGLPSVLIGEQIKLCLLADDSDLVITEKVLNEIETTAQNDLKLINNYFRSRNLLGYYLTRNKCHILPHTKSRENPKPEV